MAQATATKRVAILGGGIAALTTAFELTNTPGVEVTVHTLGWRLGGKCASSRGPNQRIEEHGIHGFCGAYFNALPMMAAVYAELDRPASSPIPDFAHAFRPIDTVQLYNWVDGKPQMFPLTFPENKLFPDPGKPQGMLDVLGLIEKVLAMLAAALAEQGEISIPAKVRDILHAMLEQVKNHITGVLALEALELVKAGWHAVRAPVLKEALASGQSQVSNIVLIIDYVFTLVYGVLQDDVVTLGWDHLDTQNWSEWLAAKGAMPETLVSPLALNTPNLSYQYPGGRTDQPSQMAAGAYAHWTLRSFAYCGHVLYAFAAGTGETIIAPLYEVLKTRGVKFAFFSKVEELALNADGSAVDSVTIRVQATPKAGLYGYDPLFTPTDTLPVPSWPSQPFFDQLEEGPALQKLAEDDPHFDLESWWCPWRPDNFRTLEAGRDFDTLVFALSIGAVQYVARALTDKSDRWQRMVDKLPTVRTQAMQVWLTESYEALGWTPKLPANGTPLADTFYAPLDGHAELRHLIPFEAWPANIRPQSLWYFCDCLPDDGEQPPFSDTSFPRVMSDRVKATCIDYLNTAMPGLLPKTALPGAGKNGGVGMNFGYLVNDTPRPGVGPELFDTQFWRANIDPTERYVTSPPNSTAVRLVAWDTDFANLVIAGDWAYTGLNVGSVECTVMSGKLASHAITGSPPLSQIPGYPANRKPLPPI